MNRPRSAHAEDTEEEPLEKRPTVGLQTPLFASSKGLELDRGQLNEFMGEGEYSYVPPVPIGDILDPAYETSASVRALVNRPESSQRSRIYHSREPINSTSTVYASNTIVAPDMNQVIFW